MTGINKSLYLKLYKELNKLIWNKELNKKNLIFSVSIKKNNGINIIIADLDKPEDLITFEEKSANGKKTFGNVPYMFKLGVVKTYL